MSSKTYPTLETESRLFGRGNRFVIGVDEVGRGAIAGPVAVGVCLLDSNNPNLMAWPAKLQDSKLMTPNSRTHIVEELRNYVAQFRVGYATNNEIDQVGISEALRLAASRALNLLFASDAIKSALVSDGCMILLDGSHNWLGKHAAGLEVANQIKADASCVSVSSAAVLAKVERDSLMQELDAEYPGYGLAGHKGYASKAHIEALRSLGPSAIHRLTWLTRILA